MEAICAVSFSVSSAKREEYSIILATACLFNERRFFDFYRVNSISEEETDLKEFAECVTYKQAKKICDFLGMPFEKV